MVTWRSIVGKIAILGAEATFKDALHVGRPNIGNRRTLENRFNDLLDRRWLSNDGPFVQQFETAIAAYIGVKHCIAVCNATVGLELAIRALDLKGEVIVPSYTFVATAHALQWQEITPVFADIDPATYNLDPNAIGRLITPRTTGILGVHVWGRPCDIDGIENLARFNGLAVLYDAAHAFGCSYRGEMIGRFGRCEVFSFHATKFLNSFEGGAVVTNDDALAERLRWMRNFGFSGYDKVVHLGVNGKMTEVCGAMGLTSLEGVSELIVANKDNYHAYREQLSGLPGISLIEYDHNESNNYQYIVVNVDPDKSPLIRDELIEVLHAENVLARRYFWPGCHKMEPYCSLQPNAGLLLKETERVGAQVVVLPTGQTIDVNTIRLICDIIRVAFNNADAVRAAYLERRRHKDAT